MKDFASGETRQYPTLKTGRNATRDDNSQDVLKNITAQVQNFLHKAGLYPGPSDGVNGPMTMDAVRSYQAIHNMDMSGEIDTELLTHMLQHEDAPLTLRQGSGF